MYIRVQRKSRYPFSSVSGGYEYKNIRTLPSGAIPVPSITTLMLLEGDGKSYFLLENGFSRIKL